MCTHVYIHVCMCARVRLRLCPSQAHMHSIISNLILIVPHRSISWPPLFRASSYDLRVSDSSRSAAAFPGLVQTPRRGAPALQSHATNPSPPTLTLSPNDRALRLENSETLLEVGVTGRGKPWHGARDTRLPFPSCSGQTCRLLRVHTSVFPLTHGAPQHRRCLTGSRCE